MCVHLDTEISIPFTGPFNQSASMRNIVKKRPCWQRRIRYSFCRRRDGFLPFPRQLSRDECCVGKQKHSLTCWHMRWEAGRGPCHTISHEMVSRNPFSRVSLQASASLRPHLHLTTTPILALFCFSRSSGRFSRDT